MDQISPSPEGGPVPHEEEPLSTHTIRLYTTAIKPGIVVSNTLIAVAAYVFVASRVDIIVFLGLALGTAGIVASGCVLNNHFDRSIDARMQRTAGRGQTTGAMSVRGSLIYCIVLGLTGAAVLWASTNAVTVVVGVLGWVLYSFVYTWAKRHTVHATLIGTVPGALPVVAGVTAAGARPGTTGDAVALFLILVTWQIAHFYAISIRRRTDYAAAGVPAPAVAYGPVLSARIMLVAVIVFFAAVLLLGIIGSASIITTVVLGTAALYWLVIAVRGQQRTVHFGRWATSMFTLSLILISLVCLMLFLDPLMP